MVNTSRLPGVASDSWWRDTQRELAALRAEVAELRRSIGKQGFTFSTEALTIRDDGAIVIEDGGALRMEGEPRPAVPAENPDDPPIVPPSADLLHIGDVTSTHRGLIMRQPDGTPIFIAADDGVSVIDGRGNDVVATDRDTQYGLSAPKIPWPARKHNGLTWDYVKNDSGQWRRAWTVEFPMWHPWLYIEFVVRVADGTAPGTQGQARAQMKIGTEVVWEQTGDLTTTNSTISVNVPVHEIEGASPSTYAVLQLESFSSVSAGMVHAYVPIVRGESGL